MSCGKRTSSCAVLLLLYTVLVLSGATNEVKNNSFTCDLQCEVPPGKTKTKCTLTADPMKMTCPFEVYSDMLLNVTSLELSDNNLTQAPTCMFPFCKSLTILSLAQNNIKTIEYGTFADLRNLTSLDLSFNDLREWRVDRNELQSLNYLDVTGNEHWTPSEQLLQLKNLATVQGVTWNKYCRNCSLVKRKSDSAEVDSTYEGCSYDRLSSPSMWHWHEQIQYGKALDFIKLGFWPTCLCDSVCLTHQRSLPFYQAAFGVTRKASFSLYATGSVALLVNITVVLVILCHKSLRGNLAVRLVLNIAVCDVLVGLVSLLYARYNYETLLITAIESLFDELEESSYDVRSKIETTRNIMGPILTCAVVSQVFGSFILTLEKFLKIVFAMKPDIRIGKLGVMLFLFVSWSFSLTFAVLPAFNVGQMSYNRRRDAIPLPADQLGDERKATVGIAAGSQIVLIIIQFTSFVLYLPIFIVSKRSGASVGIKREATIARKIALLVFTNLIFFTIPAMLGVFHLQLFYTFKGSIRQNYALTGYQWITCAFSLLSVLRVSINSVLNPFLYALRHPKIKQQLNTILCRCRNVLSECFAALRLHLPCCHSNACQPGNDIEMN